MEKNLIWYLNNLILAISAEPIEPEHFLDIKLLEKKHLPSLFCVTPTIISHLPKVPSNVCLSKAIQIHKPMNFSGVLFF